MTASELKLSTILSALANLKTKRVITCLRPWHAVQSQDSQGQEGESSEQSEEGSTEDGKDGDSGEEEEEEEEPKPEVKASWSSPTKIPRHMQFSGRALSFLISAVHTRQEPHYQAP